METQTITQRIREHQGFLTPQEESQRKLRIEQTNNWLKEHKKSEYKRVREQSEEHARQQLRADEKVLNERAAPRDLKSTERNKLYARAKYLESKIKTGMCSRDEMYGKRHSNPGNPNSKYQEAIPSIVNKHLKWLEKTQAYQDEWKNIMRVLEPDDPYASNVERLRKIH